MKSKNDTSEYDKFLHDLSGFYNSNEEKETAPIGKRLKEIRELEGMDINTLSGITGIDKNKLQGIENQEIFPDIETIIRLSKALRIATGLLMGEKSGYSYSVVKKNERKKTTRFISGTREKPDYHYQSLANGVKARHMAPYTITLSPENQNIEFSSHDGEEFIVVIEGEVIVTLGNREELLSEGDSIYYLSTIPHMVRNTSKDRDAVIIAVIYDG